MATFLTSLKKELKTHGQDYLFLILGGIIFLFALNSFQGKRLLSFLTVVVFVISYIFWSIYHHGKVGVLEFKNVVEYILIGGMVLFLIGIIFLF